jgi:hypothetical protein
VHLEIYINIALLLGGYEVLTICFGLYYEEGEEKQG